ncbi:serine hydrolase [Micromonospora sp. WMMD1120]|uniref:serine hydrolase domain-containing protein n=1 Tax=Micromonospora sp. WMMD1120 TaxID=3016106 RepID=UPI0004973747|nr:serine hydrolase domain-containing protein [Micromonospora sp. WMMD1120]MDG4807719.1 serine hydrolase [Micromonospora sp. WMMD1120]
MNSANTSAVTTAAALADRLGEPGVILRISQPDQLTAQSYTGSASLELAAPIGENTAFNAGSVAKQITAYLCIRAARDRLLTLDRPVGDILPRFRIPDVTIGDLIQHQGGVRDAESMLSLAGFRELDHYTADDLLQLAYRQRHRAVEPGSFLYSNTGYLLLAEALTHAYGAGLHEIADRHVFTPLSMTSAQFKTDPREVIPGAAASYQAVASGWQHQQRPVTLPGPGSLWCTAADLDRWLAYLWHEWRPSDADALPFDQHLGYQPSDHAPFTYGAGLYADPRPGRTVVFHYGHEQGFSAAVHLTCAGLRVICLSNDAGIAADHVVAAAFADPTHDSGADPNELLNRALGSRPARKTTCTGRAGTEAAHTMLGTYVCDEVPGSVRLTRSAGSLYLWRRGTRDRLTRSGSSYRAEGYALTPNTSPMATFDDVPAPSGFVLDLDRAPGLHYRRRSD